MKFGIIREGKTPPDRRVVFPPDILDKFRTQFPQAEIKVQSSNVRYFPDEAYKLLGFEVAEDVSDCDILIGVKEVPIKDLIPNKTYFFFSHTTKKQPYNQKLLQTCLQKNIRLIDHENLKSNDGMRLVAFGKYAGIVGAYNGLLAYGLRTKTFDIAKAEDLASQTELLAELQNIDLPPLKIVLTGVGRVARGAREMLDGIDIPQVSMEEFLDKEFKHAVYVQLEVGEYYKRKDSYPSARLDFFKNPDHYESDFKQFAESADIFIAGHFYKEGSPYILTQEMLQNPKNKIQVVADISCDIAGPIASTIRPSTIANPIYGYDPTTGKEVPYDSPNSITVMAVDNLPCELPKDASEGFGQMFLKEVVPAFFNGDKDGILDRGTICENGDLAPAYGYLEDYAFPRNE